MVSMGKLFAAACLSSSKRKNAHMVWDGSEFNLTKPEVSSRLTLNASLHHIRNLELIGKEAESIVMALRS